MDLDSIPTVESLLNQNAIGFTGRADWIERFKEVASLKNGLALYDVPWTEIMPPVRKSEVGQASPSIFDFIRSHPIFDRETGEKRVLEFDDDKAWGPRLINNEHATPLYTVHFDDDISVTAHIRRHDGYIDKLIHKKANVNPKRLTHSLKAAVRAIDISKVFASCQQCNRLFEANNEPHQMSASCAEKACSSKVAQDYNPQLAVTSSYIYSEFVRVDRFEDMIAISIGLITWTGPHEGAFNWYIEKKMSLSATPRQVKSAAKAMHDSKVATGKCIHCKETVNIGHMWNHDTCSTCAYGVYGVIF
jgi:hypothetical protein